MIKTNKILERIAKQKENRYGISVVYGLPVDFSILNLVKSIKKNFGNEYSNLLKWSGKNNLHATIVRGNSVKTDINPPVDLSTIVLMFKKVKPFYIIPSKLELFDDGVLRLNFTKTNSLININKYYIKKFAKETRLELDIILKPWLKIANINNINIKNKITHLYQLINDMNFIYISKMNAVYVKTLMVVYYRDINYSKRVILKRIHL